MTTRDRQALTTRRASREEHSSSSRRSPATGSNNPADQQEPHGNQDRGRRGWRAHLQKHPLRHHGACCMHRGMSSNPVREIEIIGNPRRKTTRSLSNEEGEQWFELLSQDE